MNILIFMLILPLLELVQSGLLRLLAAQAGLKILLVDENFDFGGSLLCENDIKINSLEGKGMGKKTTQTPLGMSNVTVLNKSTSFWLSRS